MCEYVFTHFLKTKWIAYTNKYKNHIAFLHSQGSFRGENTSDTGKISVYYITTQSIKQHLLPCSLSNVISREQRSLQHWMLLL